MPDLYNQLRVDLDESVAPGTVASVKFRDQLFMEVTAAERLAVTSVNGSTSIPIEVYGAPDGDVDLTIGYSHDGYESVLEDYALDDPLLGSISLIGSNKIRLHIDPLAPAGSVIEVYAIETLVARVQVVNKVIFDPALSAESGEVVASHNLKQLFGDDISLWPLQRCFISFIDGSLVNLGLGAEFLSSDLAWKFISGGSWGSASIEMHDTIANIGPSYNGKIYKITAIEAGDEIYIVV